ncbi:MAG: NAD(P)-dependent alcohol dehydrogenase [Chloroflexota bacterium]
MKAFVNKQYGSPDVLNLEEVEKPTPTDDEIRVKIHAVSGNPYDWHFMRGEPFLARFEAGLFKPKRTILGVDFAGTVETVGKDVTGVQPGDEVFGASAMGAFAQYVCVPVKRFTRKPANITFEEAAAIPIAALTAIQGLRTGGIESGKKVLINGASGGVGTYAVQLAKHYGAEVTGVCSSRNVEMVRSIGADHVVDYTKEDVTRSGQHYDQILEAVGNFSIAATKRILTPNGHSVVVGYGGLARMFQILGFAPLASRMGSQTVGMMGAKIASEDMALLAELMEAGSIKSVIDRQYPFEELPEAIRYLETGRARGKVVIRVV